MYAHKRYETLDNEYSISWEVVRMELTPMQKELLDNLKNRGASFGTLILVGTVFNETETMLLLADRLNEIELRENRFVTDQEILRVATDLMKEATTRVSVTP